MNSIKSAIKTPISELALTKRPSRRDMLEYTPKKYIFARCAGDDVGCIDAVIPASHYMEQHLPSKITKRRPSRSDMLGLIGRGKKINI